MAYELQWGSRTPGHLVFVVDFSGSMDTNNKYKMVMDALAECLRDISGSNIQGDTVFERFTLTVIGYNDAPAILFKGGVKDTALLLAKRKRLNKQHKGDTPYRDYMFYDEKTGQIPKRALPQFMTYTTDALKMAKKDVEEWMAQQKSNGVSMPAPIVISITDGHPEEMDAANPKLRRDKSASMADALKVAEEMKNLKTSDGNLLLFNIHFDPAQSKAELVLPSLQPTDEERRFLFNASSVVPSEMLAKTKLQFPSIASGSRFMISNAVATTLLKFILFGSTISQQVGDGEQHENV